MPYYIGNPLCFMHWKDIELKRSSDNKAISNILIIINSYLNKTESGGS
jgi:hypothetical protein